MKEFDSKQRKTERYRNIPGFGTRYFISNKGRVVGRRDDNGYQKSDILLAVNGEELRYRALIPTVDEHGLTTVGLYAENKRVWAKIWRLMDQVWGAK